MEFLRLLTYIILIFVFLFFFEEKGKKKNDLLLLIYLGFLYIIFSSMWIIGMGEFLFVLITALLVAILRTGFYSFVLLVFQFIFAALSLPDVFNLPSAIFISAGTLIFLLYIGYFHPTAGISAIQGDLSDNINLSGDEESEFLKKIEDNVRSKMSLVSTMDEEILFFHYLKKGSQLRLGFSNHKNYVKPLIPWEGVPYLKELIKSAKISIQEEPQDNIRKFGLFTKEVIISGMIIKPLIINGEVEGIMGFATSNRKRFEKYTPFYERYLDDLGEYFQSRRIYKKLLKEKNEFHFFYNALADLNRSKSIQDISKTFLASLEKIFPVNLYSFIEVNSGYYRIIHTTSKEAIVDKSLELDSASYLNSLLAKPDLRIVNTNDKRRIKLNISGSVESLFNTGTFIAMPIMTSADNPYIVLLELKSRTLTPNEKKMLSILSDNLQHIIDNMALLERFSNLANYDGLTEIYNHKKFQEEFAETLKHSKSPKREFCILMLDIDHFKSFNDTYGHKTGDVVLQKVARSLEKSVKDNDTVARYGGEEFIVLIRDAGISTGKNVAERIRKNIENIRLDVGEEVIRITISGGLSLFPDMGLDRSTLIEKADKALYISKENGRNRITVYDVQENI